MMISFSCLLINFVAPKVTKEAKKIPNMTGLIEYRDKWRPV